MKTEKIYFLIEIVNILKNQYIYWFKRDFFDEKVSLFNWHGNCVYIKV